MDKETFKWGSPAENPSIIKVIGVGGGGGNVVTHMYYKGIKDVNLALCNTDVYALEKSDVPEKIYLGRAGFRPDIAQSAAEEKAKEIETLLNDGTEMVFIIAGMGGCTGTGAAPVIAKIAKRMSILTVGIVTIPFRFEGAHKNLQAWDGVKKMGENVDALLILNNESLYEIWPEERNVADAFKRADVILTEVVESIAEISTTPTPPGNIALDFVDIKTILRDGGITHVGRGVASGTNRVSMALNSAFNSPTLVNNITISKAKKLLLHFVCSSNAPLMSNEMNELDNFMTNFNKDIEVIWGTATDESLNENIKITVLASGFEIKDVENNLLRLLNQ